MSKLDSFKNEPWRNIQDGNFKIFDNCVDDTLVTYKINQKTEKSGIAFSSSMVQQSGKTKLDNTLKVWFPFTVAENRTPWTIYGRLKSDTFKLHIDHGTFRKGTHSLNFFSTIHGNKKFEKSNYKLGLQVKRSWLTSAFRVRYSGQNPGWTLLNKSYLNKNNWQCWVLNGIDLSNNTWNSFAIQGNWKDRYGNDWFLRGNGGQKYQKVQPLRLFQNATLNWIHKHTQSTTFGLQAQGSLVEPKLRNLAGVCQYRSLQNKDTGIRVKGDTDLNFGVSIKNSIKNYGRYVFGVQVNGLGRTNSFKYGIQVELDL